MAPAAYARHGDGRHRRDAPRLLGRPDSPRVVELRGHRGTRPGAARDAGRRRAPAQDRPVPRLHPALVGPRRSGRSPRACGARVVLRHHPRLLGHGPAGPARNHRRQGRDVPLRCELRQGPRPGRHRLRPRAIRPELRRGRALHRPRRWVGRRHRGPLWLGRGGEAHRARCGRHRPGLRRQRCSRPQAAHRRPARRGVLPRIVGAATPHVPRGPAPSGAYRDVERAARGHRDLRDEGVRPALHRPDPQVRRPLPRRRAPATGRALGPRQGRVVGRRARPGRRAAPASRDRRRPQRAGGTRRLRLPSQPAQSVRDRGPDVLRPRPELRVLRVRAALRRSPVLLRWRQGGTAARVRLERSGRLDRGGCVPAGRYGGARGHQHLARVYVPPGRRTLLRPNPRRGLPRWGHRHAGGSGVGARVEGANA